MTNNKLQILIVDDNTIKSAKVRTTVEEAILTDNYQIQHAMTACEAYRLLQDNQYDLLILDVNIPIRVGDTLPNRNGGVSILHKVTSDSSIRRPTHIIGLTEYDDIVVEHSNEFNKRAWNLIKYENDSCVWSIAVTEKINHIIACSNKIAVSKVKVLFLAADPSSYSTNGLAIDKERRDIQNKITSSRYRDAVEFIDRWAVRVDDIMQVLNEVSPHIVHFSGHGCKTGQLVVLGPDDAPHAIEVDALTKLFEVMKGNIKLVVLNACFSRTQARAITQHIDYCIGMNDTIKDITAIEFAAAFYRAIGFGKSIKNAYDQGITTLMLHKIDGKDIPELICRTGCVPDNAFML